MAPANIEHELTAFITQGASAWIRQYKSGQCGQRTIWTKPVRGSVEVDIIILLANIIES
ncbi:MAG: hypothetical protein LBI13_05225 [Streptococcaceae bacterium]|nr:hypothetical protein [Streptococcaceae bacterium]